MFKPIEPGKVKCMYVDLQYNYIHIGNAVQQLIMTWYVDILNIKAIRLITYPFTDVDDKLINRSKELNESVPEIVIDISRHSMKM